ncbi:NAD(P)H-dependent oxidoreductase [Arthrobacter sp. GCM10027362]|uniref:NAD(P)H-dependent oxidoreductase n=1 Tax=Arthrobacter sp. GCM10027362 TaxID=3273379 RepID=UPI0036426F31
MASAPGPAGDRPIRVATLDGSYFPPSKTTMLLDLAAQELGRHRQVGREEINVAELGPGFASALSREDLAPEVLGRLRAFETADAIIAGSPVYQGSYSGLFKHFIDFVGQGALADTPVLLVADGGSERHLLMIDHELRPLFAFLQAFVVPASVFAAAGDFDGLVLLNSGLRKRVRRAVSGLLRLL